jgi:hypothetical protein
MANEFKIKKGLIVTGASGGTVVDIQGSQGQLFSVTDNLSGSIFAVSDISGVPILDVNSSGLVTVDGPFTQTGGGATILSGTLDVDGEVTIGSGEYLSWGTSGATAIEGSTVSNRMRFYTDSTLALTLDSTQNATFAGDVTVSGGDITVSNAITGISGGSFRVKNNGGTTIATFADDLSATFAAQAFATTATSSGNASSTLTTKGYVDSLITGATIYRGAWQAGISATSSAATTASTTLTVTAAILDADGNTPVLVGAVVTGEGITGTVKVASVTSSTVYVLDTAIDATATAYIFSPIYGAPSLDGVTETSGYYYICSEAGSATPNGANSEPNTWNVGDWCIYNDVSGTGQWQKIDNSSVLSGAGTGQTVALWEGPSSVTDSDTLGNAPITFNGNNATFAGTVEAATYYKSSGTSAVLGTDTSGEVLLRPTSSISSTAQSSFTTTLATIGTDATFAGDVTIAKSTPKLTFNNLAGGGLDPSLTASGTNFTVSTSSITPLSLALDTGNATFAGNVTLSSTAPILYLDNTTATTGKNWRLSSAANGKMYITQDGVVDAITLDHTSGNATFAGNVIINNTTPPNNLAQLNIGSTSGGETRAIDIDGNWTAGESKSITFAYGTDATHMVGQINCVFNTSTDSRLRWGKLYHGGVSSTYTMELKSTSTTTANLTVAGSIQMADDTDTASADKVGTMRYRTGTEYVEVDGVELVTNGDFATDTDWTKGANTTISGGTLNSTAIGVYVIANQGGVVSQSLYYKWTVTYTITSGGIRLGDSSNVWAGSDQTASGTYTGFVQAASTADGNLYMTSPSSNFIGSVDNVSVIEVTEEDASYADMCMQTGSSTYEWVNIVRNTY